MFALFWATLGFSQSLLLDMYSGIAHRGKEGHMVWRRLNLGQLCARQAALVSLWLSTLTSALA